MASFKSSYPDVELRDQSITEMVFEGLVNRPDEVVLTDGPSGRSMTAAQFVEQVKRLAGGLTAQGFGEGHVLALMAPNMPEYCVIFHAVAWAGGTITTLNPTYTASEVTHQLNDSKAEILFTVPDFLQVARAGVVGTGTQRIVTIGEVDGETSLDSMYGEPLAAQVPVDLDKHPAVLPYSSGTTGLPKGVMLSHRNLVVNVQQAIVSADFQAGEVVAGFLPFFHIYGMSVVMNMHLAGGGAVVTLPRFDLALFLQICQDYKSRRMWVVPPVALALAKHPMVDDYTLDSVELVFSGAAPLGAEVSDAVAKRLNCTALQAYGMTELSPISHISPISGPRSGSSGLAAPNTECRIVDIESGEDLGAGEEGELWIKGPQVMQGYLNKPEATAECLSADGWLRTGDIATIDSDGFMYIVDRLKELIKFKGFQVAPAELEATLLTHSNITDAAVIGLPDEEAGELPIAFVVSNDASLDEESVKAFMGETLAHYKKVHQVHFVESIPKSASGKILRRLLRDELAKS